MLFNNCEFSDLLCTVNMKLSMAILYLIVAIAFSQTSQEIGNSFGATINEHFDCINDSSCPTWFTCNSQNSCECGDEHNYAVVCDAGRKESAVLDTYCVTYDRKSKSTYLGQCFYNCQNGDKKNKLDSVFFAKVHKVLCVCDTVPPCRVHVHMFTIIQFLRANIHTVLEGQQYVY